MINLKNALMLDFVVTGAIALLQVTGAELLSPWLGISVSLLRATGIFLLLFVGLLGYIIAKQKFASPLVKGVIGMNILWALECLGFILLKKSELTGLGMAFVVVQVAAVLVFAELQILSAKGLKKRLIGS